MNSSQNIKIVKLLEYYIDEVRMAMTNDEVIVKETMDKIYTLLQKSYFNDATLRRVLRKISVINMEAKHRIVKISLSDKDKELMALLEEEIEERL
ncbi:hypothetical protein Tco_0996090 [Tanacetum coccineum]